MRRAALIAAVGGLALLSVGAVLVVGAADDLSRTRLGETRTGVPGQRTVELEQRKYVLFYEVGGGAEAAETDYGDVDVRIASASDPSTVLPLDSYGSEFTVDSGGRSAVATNTVDVPAGGSYRVSVTGASDGSEPSVVLGEPSRSRVLRLVLGIVVLVLGVLIGIAALVLAIVGRTRRRGD